MNAFSNAWTEDRIEALKKLWEDGLSASQIAAELGREPFNRLPYVSRNAVIGKIHRMGLGERAKGQQRSGASPRRPRNTQVKGKSYIVVKPKTRSVAALALEPDTDPDMVLDPAAIAEFDNVIPMTQRITLLELNASHCRWPIGDPQSPDFAFCGGRALEGVPYCAGHTRIAYQPAADRRRRRVEV